MNESELFTEMNITGCWTKGVPCNASISAAISCGHGTCCILAGDSICACEAGWEGPSCNHRELDVSDGDYYDFSRSAMNTITAYTVVNVVIGLLLLIGFAVLVVVTIWKKLSIRKNDSRMLERNLSEIEDEIDRMPTVQRMKELTRLSKKFEASARATIEQEMALLSIACDERLTAATGNTKLVTTHVYLPRWSSAPSNLLMAEELTIANGTPNGGGVDMPDSPCRLTAINGGGGKTASRTASAQPRRYAARMFSTPI